MSKRPRRSTPSAAINPAPVPASSPSSAVFTTAQIQEAAQRWQQATQNARLSLTPAEFRQLHADITLVCSLAQSLPADFKLEFK